MSDKINPLQAIYDAATSGGDPYKLLTLIEDIATKALHPSESPKGHVWVKATNPWSEEDETTPTIHPTTDQFELVFIPCAEDDPLAVGGYTSFDGQSLCHVREGHVPVHPNKEDAAREQKGVRDSKWLIGRSEERFKELEHYGWHWTSFYNGWLEGRMDMVGEDAAGSQKQYPWGPDQYPDLSACTPEQKHETIFGLIQLAAKEIMRMFYAFGLKTHIECKVVNEPTNETFEFSFVKVDAAAGSGKEEAVEIARRNKIIEDNLKLSMRQNMPGVSEQEQERTWQEFKKRNNL